MISSEPLIIPPSQSVFTTSTFYRESSAKFKIFITSIQHRKVYIQRLQISQNTVQHRTVIPGYNTEMEILCKEICRVRGVPYNDTRIRWDFSTPPDPRILGCFKGFRPQIRTKRRGDKERGEVRLVAADLPQPPPTVPQSLASA
ncbi:hypothetical protein BV898_13830 [Hypsibius exemplaris]|uniref:Uncharacterized protein n=1 Tax=Hypsibius exemplaris TaxID=2072580 RepID=A0A1W0W9N3_HYPEX|nr:hypothetical protein BV898_13830 [Hypsibius exemplaris]